MYKRIIYLILSFIIISIILIIWSLNIIDNNSPPNKPKTPVGYSTINMGSSADYITSTIDPDKDDIKYGWDWNGDKIVDEWTKWYPSNFGSIKTRHKWLNSGTFYVKVLAKDVNEDYSLWSDNLTVIVNRIHNPPNNPFISGPTELKVGQLGTYYVNSTTPDGSKLRYYFRWDVGKYYLTEFVESGIIVNASYSWDIAGKYDIIVEAENEFFERSYGSFITVTIID